MEECSIFCVLCVCEVKKLITSLSLECPGFALSLGLATTRNIRIFALRYLCLPRSRPVKLVHERPNPNTQLYNFERKTLQPWYVKPTAWATRGPPAWIMRAVGGKVPGPVRFQPEGYDLFTIGPDPAKGKGIDDMKITIASIKEKGVATCPFSQAKVGELSLQL